MSQPKVKKRVGKYEIGRTIGEGKFAKVKFARNSETGEPVALKILDKEKVLKHKMAQQIRREIATLKLIKHPNIVFSIRREIATMKLIKHPNVIQLYDVNEIRRKVNSNKSFPYEAPF